MAREFKLVDPFLNMPRNPAEKADIDPNIARWFKDSKAMIHGATPQEMLADMDEAGIEKGMITVNPGQIPTGYYTVGQNVTEASFEAACEQWANLRKVAPDRIFGCIWIDPTGMMQAVRQLERAVRDFGFKACHLMPSVTGLPPTHACYYPIYMKCVELGIPLKINVGVPGPLRPAEPQRTYYLDEVCVAFPELTVVGTHVGHPWHMESVALLQKHANFYMITSGFAPKHVPQEIWDVANKRVPHKVMWSSDYPILPMQRCAQEGWEAPLRDHVRQKYLRDNALEVFKLG